ncbi:MAG: response regulator/GGDEF protein [Polyangiaceae bacterium]|jgi:diguanylate cyclase (GGDEF)-like protein|nr:response regulator/GGDEF protein [Polyangiaceae bacterium]
MKANLLLIDDSEAQSTQICNSLERLGYRVTRASSGVEGLRLARTTSPDLVLLDVVMADIDGFAVCRWLKMNAETRDIPVIMLTVRTALADRVEGLNIGADDYLAKPFEDQELEARIFAALRVKAAHAELRDRNQQLESMLHHVEALASTDALTGLYNRRRFADVLRREFAVTKRYKNTLSCLLLDLDHFKQINDRFGHDAGDQVLKEMARRITGSLREVDLAARYGGEEFVVLLPHTGKADANIVAERLLKNVRKQEFNFGGEMVTVTASIGCAGNSDVASSNPDDLVKAADVALYEAKKRGRNRVVMYTAGADERAIGSSNSLPAPAMPFPASLPAPAGPFAVNMPGGVRLPPLGKPLGKDPSDGE